MGILKRDLKPTSSCKELHYSLSLPCFATGFHPVLIKFFMQPRTSLIQPRTSLMESSTLMQPRTSLMQPRSLMQPWTNHYAKKELQPRNFMFHVLLIHAGMPIVIIFVENNN